MDINLNVRCVPDAEVLARLEHIETALLNLTQAQGLSPGDASALAKLLARAGTETSTLDALDHTKP